MNKICEAALKYAKRGWSVFPVKRNKAPYTDNGFHDATTDPSIILKWWQKFPDANVGIATGHLSHGLTVIDIDIDRDKGIYGDESFDGWCDEQGVYIDSLNAVTGRGGKHLYFLSNYPYGSKIGVLDGVDIKGEGGYVIAPPSIHENGNEYYFDGDEDEDEIVCVQEDSDVEYFLNEMCNTSGDNPPLEIPSQTNEGNRNEMLFKMASSLQSKGTDDDVILSICQGYNEKNCNPPLDDDEVELIVKNVITRYEKGTPKQPGTDNHSSIPAEFPPLQSANDIKNKKMEELKVYIGVDCDVPFLVEGTCVLSSKPKIGKSWFCNNLCKALTDGKDFLGYKVNQCHVIYFDLETVEQLQQKRLKKMSDDDYAEGFWISSDKYLIGEGFEEMISNYLTQDPKIGVIIVDVFQKIRKPKKANESEYETVYKELTTLGEIAKRYHISIILVTHDRKNVEDTDPFSNILGSTALQGASDQMIVMYKTRFDDPITHIAVKGRTIDGLIKLDAMISNGTWVKTEGAELVMLEKKKEEYLSNEYRAYMVDFVKEYGSWSGRCNEFVRLARKKGIIDDDISLKELGGFFSSTNNKKFAESIDHIQISDVKNGSGSKTYSLTVDVTVDTVDEEWLTVDENPWNMA